MAQCQKLRAQMARLFFGLHLCLTGKYCEINPKMPGTQLNENPARAITWFVGATIYCAITIYLHPVLKLYNFARGNPFAALTNFSSTLVEIMYFRRRNWMKIKQTNKQTKKVFGEIWSYFSEKSGENQKKISSPQFATIFGREFV